MESKVVFTEEDYFEDLDGKTFQELDLNRLRHSLQDETGHKELMVVPRNRRRSSQQMTQAEHTAVLSLRAQHLQNGATPFIDTGDEHDYVKIAEMEILAHKCPLAISRVHSNGFMVEIWDVNEMILPFN